jgi:hypothetical protein
VKEEQKFIQMLNSLDEDLVNKEVDKILEGVEFDMNSIKEKAYQKLNNNKKGKKRTLYVATAACLCFLSISAVYASDISDAIKSFFNKTQVYSTIVDGDAYYLEKPYNLNDKFTLESVMVSEENFDMEISTTLSESELDKISDITVIPKDNPNIIYSPGGYGCGEGKFSLSFMNKTEGNYNIKPFKDFKLTIAGKSYNVSLDKAKGLDTSNMQTSNASENGIKGVNLGAKFVDGKGKRNIQIVASFDDKDLKLSNFGQPNKDILKSTFENLGKDGTLGSSSNSKGDKIYAYDEENNKYEMKVPKDAKAYPVTIFETDTLKGKNLKLEIPSVIASYQKEIDTLGFNIPKSGEVTLDKEIDFNIQKAVLKNIKRISPTSAQVEFKLNTGGDKNIKIREFNFYSDDIKKISSEFNGDKAIMNLEFNKDVDKANISISWPVLEINGNWEINIK